MASERSPDFIVAGAPKCGTTSLHHYLSQVPDLYMPREKEPNYFSTDIRLRKQKTLEEYLGLFSDAPADALAGEVSVWYLVSEVAAEAILETCGRIPIVVMLRNPVEAMYSMHAQLVYEGDEHILDFAEALAAEPERRAGGGVHPDSWKGPECFCYRRIYDYADQLQRYFTTFGRDRVHVILFDDFRRDTRQSFDSLCDFLGVPVAPNVDLRTHNPNTTVSHPGLRDLRRRHERGLRRLGRTLLPGRHLQKWIRQPVARALKRPYTRVVSRQPMAVDLRQRLVDQARPGIERLESLLDRDLSAWTVSRAE